MCHNCNVEGHFRDECYRPGDGAYKPGGGAYKRNKANDRGTDSRRMEISSDENGLSNSNYFLMKKFDVIADKPVVEQRVKAKKAVHGADVSPRVLSANAVQNNAPLPVIKASFIVEGRYVCDFEIATNASHTTISPLVFRKAQYVAKNKPTLGQEQTMGLADGSFSDSKCRLTHLSLARADKPYDTATFPVMVSKDLMLY